jgi:putative peptidoglycan lipid II flippase
MLKLKPESIRHAIIKTSTINLLARGFGYLKHLAIAILLGFSYQTDAFFMALSLLGIFMIFVDVFDSIGVPQLVFARMKSEEEFKKLAGLLLTFTTILAFSLTFIALVGIPLLSKVAVGFDQRTKEATELHLLLLLPYLFLNFFFHHFGAVLRSLRYFTAYFIGEFIFSFFSFLFIVLGLYLLHSPSLLPISFSLSQLVATLYIIFVGKEFLHFTFFIDKRVKEILKHFVFLSALYGVFHLFILVDRAFASLLGEKGVSALTYGLMVAFALRSVLKLEHMAITSLSETKASIQTLNKFLKFSFLVSLPVMLFLFFFPEIPVKLLFGHGKFTKADVELTATATKYYAISLFLGFAWTILYRAFQIINWLLPVFFIALIGILINGFFNYLFVVVYKLGIAGICLGTFFAYAFLCGISYRILTRKLKVKK